MAKNPKNDPSPTIHPDTIPVPGEAGNQAIELLDKHRNVVMTVAAVAVLAICASLVLRELGRQKASEAAQAYSTAAGERSIEKLDAVTAEHAGTVPAGNALLTKADIQLAQEKFEDAKVTLLTFVEKFEDHPRHAQGLYALGNLSHRNGDFENATSFYDRALAASPSGDLGPLILIRKGDIALSQAEGLREEGKKEEAEAKVDEARQHYEDSITRPEFRSSPFIAMAESRLALAEVGDVPVVPAPPKPEPTPEPEKAPAAPAPTDDAPAPKADAPAPKADAPAPKADAPAPKADAPAPRADAPAPKADAPAPEADAPAPKADAPAPKADAPAPKADAPAPEADAPAPKADAPAPEADAPAPEADAPAPEADAPAPKADAPAPKADAPAPEAAN